MTLVTWSAVRPTVPDMTPDEADGGLRKISGLAVLVGVAGAWMCAAVAGPDSPEKLM